MSLSSVMTSLQQNGYDVNPTMMDQSCLFNATFKEDGWVFDDRKQRMSIAWILVLLSVGGVCGNAWTILNVLVSRELKTSAHAFVVSLAVGDLIIAAFVIPFYVQNLLFTGKDIPLPCWLCRLVGAVSISVCSSTMVNIAVIALNRVFRITQPPARYYRFFNKSTIPIILAFPWICGVLTSVIFSGFKMMSFGFNHKYKVCLVHFQQRKITFPSFLRFALIDAFFIIVTVICYVKLFFHTRQNKTELLQFLRKISYRTTSARSCANANKSLFPTCTSTVELIDKGEGNMSPSCESVGALDPSSMKSLPEDAVSVQNLDKSQMEERFQERPPLDESFVKNFHQDVDSGPARNELNRKDKFKSRSNNDVIIKSLNRREKTLTKNIFLVTCSILLCTIPYPVCLVIEWVERAFPYVTVLYISKCCINPLIYALRDPRFRVCPWKRKKYAASIS